MYPVELGQCNMTEYTVSSPGGNLSGGKLSGGKLSGGKLSEGSLSEGKLSEGSLSEGKTVRRESKQSFKQVASALSFMHDQGMAHMRVSLFVIVIAESRVFLVGLGQCQRKERVALGNVPKSGWSSTGQRTLIPMTDFSDGKYPNP